ncbi:MAG: polyphenol oxidase family protein [Cryobacterium sp.]|nr:polyphenol oxidase family protein [Oligoflexia bacterium]
MFQSSLLSKIPEINHGFGTKLDPVPNQFLKVWVDGRPTWNQVHGVGIANVVRKSQLCGDVDALTTKTTNPIAVVTADCVPILFARKDGAMVAAVHAGWRGTKAKIVEKLAENLTAQGENLKDWVAAIGPSIGKCCYEVSEALIEDFIKTFPEIEPDLISPAFRKLDLAAVNAHELHRLGFGAVDMLDICTYCTIDPKKGAVLHSYRREGSGTRQWSMIAHKQIF